MSLGDKFYSSNHYRCTFFSYEHACHVKLLSEVSPKKMFLKFDTDRFYNNLRIISPSLLQVLTAHTNIATRLTDVTKNVDIHLIHIQTTPNFS